MCVIIHKPAGKEIAEKDIISAARRNSHGFGYMYFDPETKQIVTDKMLFDKPEDLFEIFKSQVKYEVCYHFRIKTHGDISKDNCHPFRILSKKDNGQDLFFMHNGVINKVKEEGNESDTRAFNRQFLRPILKSRSKFLKAEPFKRLVEEFIGSSKLVFMTGTGEVIKFNEKLGAMHDGMWVSNSYSFDAPKYTNSSNSCCNATGRAYRSRFMDYEYDDTYSWSDYYKRGKGNNVSSITASKETKLLNEVVKTGDKILVTHVDTLDFLDEGIVKSIYTSAINVECKNINGVKGIVTFQIPDGYSYASNKGYQLLPITATVENFGMYKTQDLLDRTEGVKQIEDKTQKKEQTTSGIFRKSGNHPEFNFDGKDNRWGGAFVDDTSTDYDGTTILDVHEMSPQARFNFFLDKIPQAFGMFQDLVERLYIEDQEAGLFEDENGEDYEEKTYTKN